MATLTISGNDPLNPVDDLYPWWLLQPKRSFEPATYLSVENF